MSGRQVFNALLTGNQIEHFPANTYGNILASEIESNFLLDLVYYSLRPYHRLTCGQVKF